MFDQYEVIELARDLNPAIRKGTRGTILEVLSEDCFEVEFLNEKGRNLEFDGQYTFTVKSSDIKPVSS